MSTLTVQMKLPEDIDSLVGTPTLTFSHWLPVGKENGIRVTEDDIELLLWFDIESTWWAFQPSAEDLKTLRNVNTHYILADITVSDISETLAEYMQNRDFRKLSGKEYAIIQREYEEIGARILTVLLNRMNRLINYTRSIKGQYWLKDYSVDLNRMNNYFLAFKAKGQIITGNVFGFYPALSEIIPVLVVSEDKFIHENEWEGVAKFVMSERRAPLVLELLSGAEQLASNGYVRSALTEAVTAMEVAVSDFARSQQHNQELYQIVGDRLGVARLQKQIEHMGLSGTISYLLPLILPDSVLSANVLEGCRNAIDARQNVVHNGQREVPNLHQHLVSIRACCEALRKFCHSTSEIGIGT